MTLTRKQFLNLASCSTAAASIAGMSGAGRAAGDERQASGPAVSASSTRAPVAGVTAAVVDFITGAKLAAFPERAVAAGKRCLVDGFGVILAGATVEGSRIVREYISAQGGAVAAWDPRPLQSVSEGGRRRAEGGKTLRPSPDRSGSPTSADDGRATVLGPELFLPADRIQQALAQIETIENLANVRELVATLAPAQV